MAHSKIGVDVLTPEGEVFSGEVEMVSTRTSLGQIGILARHAPLLAMLDPTELRLHLGEGEVRRYAQGEGYVQVAGNHVLILVEEALEPESLDRDELRTRIERAAERYEAAEEGSEARRVAALDSRRAEAFLTLLDGEH